MALGQSAEEILVLRIAAADYRQAHVVVLQQLRQGVEQQIESLLRGEAADDAEQRHASRRGLQVLAQQEIALELGLVREFLRPEVDRQVRVVPRIPFLVIDAIEDAVHRMAARRQRLLHAHAVARRGDLARVGGADRGHAIGVQDAVLERVDAAGLEVVLVQ